MEKKVDSIVFRRLTKNDFDKINKPGSAYQKKGDKQGGGGQGYIDFPTKNITLKQWNDFLGKSTSAGAQNRPKWSVKINSLGFKAEQQVLISNRRDASVSITSQKKQEDSAQGNRINSWHPKQGFPVDYDPDATHLVVYIVKTVDSKYWAGWFLQNEVPKNWKINDSLKRLFEEDSAGYIKLKSKVLLDTENKEWAFYFDPTEIINQVKTEEDVEEDLLNQDTSPKLDEPEVKAKPEFRKKLLKIRERNKQIVKNLKKLYGGTFQISGEKFTFKMKSGKLYSEVHHLIPLGEKGSDAYSNAIVVSPLIHRMLHYANVSAIDLKQIKDHKLKIKINEKDFEITWHPNHFKTVEKSLKN